jgi:hypothetical protein
MIHLFTEHRVYEDVTRRAMNKGAAERRAVSQLFRGVSDVTIEEDP